MTLLPLLLATLAVKLDFAVCQSDTAGCPSQPICNSTGTSCLGYGELSVSCSNGTRIGYGTCYSAELCASIAADQTNDLIRISAANINPKQCYAYSGQIREKIYTAYNTWCCQGDNFLRCCPGSTGWPVGVARSPANCAAMSSAADVTYFGASGSSSHTQFLIKLNPRGESALCQLLVYSSAGSTAAAGSTSATGLTAAAASTAAGGSMAAAGSTAAAASTAGAASTAAAGPTAATSTPTAMPTSRSTAAATTSPSLTAPTTANPRRRRRRSAPNGVFSLTVQTVQLLISSVDFTSLVVSAISTASNGTLTVSVTVSQNVAPASSLSPDSRSDSWVIATGTLCGLIGLLILLYLIACSVHRSRRPAKNEDLPLFM